MNAERRFATRVFRAGRTCAAPAEAKSSIHWLGGGVADKELRLECRPRSRLLTRAPGNNRDAAPQSEHFNKPENRQGELTALARRIPGRRASSGVGRLPQVSSALGMPERSNI